ncbi:hypothetical protein GDO78_001552 [Eleutherodactylus coqui]|uniref:CD109 antigen n=1 Tax=Eleutherodactylus coqui TaxID=57060 RepID=A0A8J6FTB4_ELECQ|nr:hypothetical protein GDO78_001552 [Eleutherodactylus coqui]
MYILWPPVLRHAVFFFLCLVSCTGSPSYYIITPATTIYGANISMAVHWFGDMFSEITVAAEIFDNGNIKGSASKVFQNDLIGILTLPAVPQNLPDNSFTLAVNGSAQNRLIFSDKIQISVEVKNISVLIQTDKPLYKAGENVKIRIISVNPDLKPYKGNVDLVIKDPGYNIVQQRLSMKSDLGVVSTDFSLSDNPMLGVWNIEATCNISGFMNFSFTRAELQHVVNQEGNNVTNVTVSVTEELTGIEVNTESYILSATSEYRLNLISQQPAFGPGHNFTAKVRVQRIDNNPLSTEERDEHVAVKMTQWRGSSDSYTTGLQYTIPESGVIDLQFPVLQAIQWITINVEYRNVSEIFSSDVVYTRNPFIDIQIPDSTLKVGEEFTIEVTTYVTITEIYYVVVSKGLVVFTGRNSTNFSLIPEASWAPSAQLTVYWLNISNNFEDIMQISKTLSIKGTLNNKVSLSWSKNIAYPSEHVFLSVNVKEPHSLVGLQVVEKSSLLMGEGCDLTTNKVKYIPRTKELTVLPPRHAKIISPESWIWKNINISSSLTENVDVAVLDRNTSWVATAFVISERLGLGVVEESVEITVFKPFLMSLKMPYSVTRGEEFILEVILSSSLSKNLEGTVASQHNVTVSRRGETRVLFPVRPKKLGNISITVKATSNVASDILTKTILIKAEGIKYFYSQTALFEIIGNGNTSNISKNLSFTFPPDVVPGSKEAYITVIGNHLGPSINGLESLIDMPYGCGEQNMINFAPNIYILQYLTATEQIKGDIRERSINVMEQGYQKELTYRRYDGSFSAFGNSDSSGSTWLSAFVFRCFLQARTFIYINPMVLNETVEWLVRHQDLNTGIFSEPGRVIHKELQGGQNGPVTLTAYILTSLLEDKYYRNLYASRIERTVQYLERKFDEGIDSNYTLSIVVYALSLANSSKAHDALTLLNSKANTTEGTKFWSSPSQTPDYYWQPRATDIETAAYALLSHYQQGRIKDGIPVMKWLSQQRNHLGGYSSTQDTIIALQALSKFLLLTPSYETSLMLAVTGQDSNVPKTFHINNENLLVLQSHQIKVAQSLQVSATAVGRGLAILQLNIIYSRKSTSRHRRREPGAFQLDVTVKEETDNIHGLAVDVCMRFQGKGNESGMALLDVGYLSGFTLSPEGIISIQSLKLVEPKEDKVYLYFDSVTKEKLCVSIPMVRFAKVANYQDAVVKVSSYYSPEMSSTRTYNSLTMQQISTCDYCGFNCTQCTSNVLMAPLSSETNMPTFSFFWFCIIAVYYFL